MAEQPGSSKSGSPSDAPEERRVDDQANPRTDAPPASATTKEQPPAGESKAQATPDAVSKALEAVRTGQASTEVDEDAPTPAKPADKAPEKAPDAPPKPADGQPEKPAAKEPETDPLADWSPQEKAHTKGRVKERFRALHEMHRTEVDARAKLAADLEAAQADATQGRAFREIGEKFQVKADMDLLNDEQMAWSVRAQASALRCVNAVAAGKQPSPDDLETIDALRQGLDLVDQHLGRAKPSAPTIDHKAINAVLEEVGDYLPDEALQRLRKLVGEKPADVQAPPVKPPQAQPQRTQMQPPPAAPVAPADDAAWDAHRTKAVNAIVQSGIPVEKVDAYYKEQLLPLMSSLLRRDYPRLDPDAAWKRTPAAERSALLLEAHATALGRRTTPPPVSRPAPSAAPLRSTGRPPPQRGASTGNAVTDALNAVREGRASGAGD